MALHKTKPTSAGRRFQVKVVDNTLYKGRPHEPLVAKKSKSGGRNSAGRITVRHRGGGHKPVSYTHLTLPTTPYV